MRGICVQQIPFFMLNISQFKSVFNNVPVISIHSLEFQRVVIAVQQYICYTACGNTITVGGCLRWNVIPRTPGRLFAIRKEEIYGKYTKEEGSYANTGKCY